MSASPVRFYFDYISPNAYIAWERIHELVEASGRTVEPVPVLFAGLLDAHDAIGPAEIRAKWAWMARDLLRKSERLGIPFEPPHSHPFNPLLVLRATTATEEPAARRRLITALYRAIWTARANPADPAEVARIADEAGLDGAATVAAAGESSTKTRLRQATERAAADGVFGVPTMVADGELFWGFDDFPSLGRLLSGEEKPVDRSKLERWEAVRPTAGRRR